MHQDTVIQLLDTICRIPSYWIPATGESPEMNEAQLASFIFDMLSKKEYLEVLKQPVSESRYNVFAHAGPIEDIELLIVSHIDTVRPSIGGTIPPGTIQDNKYYHLGATDTKDGIAATLDALQNIDSLSRVGFLFYVDEEYYFEGMNAFVEKDIPLNNLTYVLSTCGARAKYQDGCRGCYEFEFVITGESGHASRKTNGRNAIDAMNHVLQSLQSYVYSFDVPYASSCNVAAIAGGSLASPITLPTTNETPRFAASGNKIPNTAWAKIDIRPGTADLTIDNIKQTITAALTAWNQTQDMPQAQATITDWHTVFAYPGYSSTDKGTQNPIFEAFKPLHAANGPHNPETSGYLDVAMIASKYPDATCILMAPDGDNQHKPDEWTSIPSTILYRDCMIALLGQYRNS